MQVVILDGQKTKWNMQVVMIDGYEKKWNTVYTCKS